MMGDPKRLGIWVSYGQVSKSSDVYLILWSLQSWAGSLAGGWLLLRFLALLFLVIAEYNL